MPALSPEARRIRARIASKTLWSPGDPAIEDDRRDFEVLKLREHIERVVTIATPEQRERLALLLRSGAA